jgi:disulfide bond formation protein DsbB
LSLDLSAAKAIQRASTEQISVAQRRSSLWKLSLAFFFGFCIQFNILIGGSGERALTTGGYGYRLIDFVALGAVGLLGIYSFTSRRILSLAVYGLIVGVLFAASALSSDPRTAILSYHYVLYSLAALYVVVVLDDVACLERFCWGLIIGLLATIPIFVMQDSAYSSMLTDWGLAPGYTQVFIDVQGDYARYSGLSGHPNEAGHIAADSAAAGAYFAFVQRRFLPTALVAAGLMAVFYYTRSRGGLIAGGAILAIPFAFARGRATLLRFVVMAALAGSLVGGVSQIDFVASRFGEDPNATNNIADRLDSILSGLQVLLAHPFGMPIGEFISYVAAGSGGVTSPHNGFIFFGGVFGILPLLVFLVACAVVFRVRDDVDLFFALFTLQIGISLLFEQLPGSYSYAFAICLIGARAFLRTRIGAEFKAHSIQYRPRYWLDLSRPALGAKKNSPRQSRYGPVNRT